MAKRTMALARRLAPVLTGGRPTLILTLVIGLVAGILWRPSNRVAVVILVVTAVLTVAHSVWEMIRNVRKGHVGVDILAVVALMSTLVVHEFWASWIVVVMIFSGAAIEEYAESRAQRNLAVLVEAAPSVAHRRDSADSEDSAAWTTITVDEVTIGDVLLVKPGETVPVDGILLSPQATLDMSMINGEPLPVDVYEGAKVASGAVNGAAPLVLRSIALSTDSQYQRIVGLVRSAQESRSVSVKTADLLAVPFTVVSFAIAFIAWAASGNPLRFAEVLVIATPCPLLIAAPVAFMGGTGRLAKAGIVIKAQDILEQLGDVTHVFFDKTGTLTRKKPQVDRVELAPWTTAQLDADALLVDAGMLETYSSHILARGVEHAAVDLLHAHGLKRPDVSEACEDTGNGVEGVIDGRRIRVGRLSYVALGATAADVERDFGPLADNEMVTFVSVDGELAGRIVLKDFPRDNARSTIARLRALGVSQVTMLTGDKSGSATIVGDAVGIEDVRAELLPEGKVDAVAAAHRPASVAPGSSRRGFIVRIADLVKGMIGLPDRGEITMMVGDGVNDAPVLAASDIGVAMTDGASTAASESAQVVIMNDDIAMVPTAMVISRQTRHVMLQAVYGGLIAAVVCMVVAGFGLIPAIVGAILQEAIDVASILWALTALIDRPTDGIRATVATDGPTMAVSGIDDAD
ncbi:heavy metal translocating P-type ATPase [uncultured Bifidobacterium sp.]|uniref:heavy metal translocating P-type ATPase n=1 Tax=uncultured Bifidobacterium sp. TaxID=165187 RepID=UPI0028DCE254|nr:heavy metal translocating P-type ATPase [uncultured Bifidobacterium sp.]